MAQWIRVDRWFGDRVMNLTIPRKDLIRREFMEITNDLKDTNEAMAALIEGLIERHRPELAGVQVIGMSLDFARAEWVFLCCHSSFPRVRSGELPGTMSLLPEVKPDVLSTFLP